MNKVQFKSRKDASEFLATKGIDTSNWSEIKWLSLNKGGAEIHISTFAECIWDVMNESKPKQLQAGEWHIPFKDKISIAIIGTPPVEVIQIKAVRISTAMAARTSYTTVGDEKEISYERLIGIHDRMAEAKPFHASPFGTLCKSYESK